MSRKKWKYAANEYKRFIQENIPIVGWREIEAYSKCKRAQREAEEYDKANAKDLYEKDEPEYIEERNKIAKEYSRNVTHRKGGRQAAGQAAAQAG